MNEFTRNFQYLWDTSIAPHWSLIIPSLFVLMAIIWLLTVYRKGNFRFLPALAIARVTVLDSIGRMEVIILLAIGIMIVGVNGIIPNTNQGRGTLEVWMDKPYFQEKLEEMSGIDTFTPPEEYKYLPDEGSDENTLSSIVDEESLQSSFADDEGAYISPVHDAAADESGPPPLGSEDDTEGKDDTSPLTRAEELAAEGRENTLNALIWQGAFLVADFFVALIGFVLAMVVLPNEMNRGVTLSILPKPLSREEYVFGKAMGIWVIVTGCFLVLTSELFLIQAVFNAIQGRGIMDWHLLMAILLFPFKYATLVLIIMGLTLRMPEVPAGIIGVALFGTGHFVDRIYEIAANPNLNPILAYGLKFSYWMMPHLSQVTFSILDRDETLISNYQEMWGWVWQISIYNILLLALLSWLFRRRSL